MVDLLVVGTSVDPHISSVLSRLGDITVCRLDVDRFPRDQSVTLEFSRTGVPKVLVHDGEVSWDVTQPKVAWFRRLGKPGVSKKLHADYKDFVIGETEQTIEGLLSIVNPHYWLNNFWGARQAGNKPLQYATATQLGLALPDTIITNGLANARHWIDDHGEVIAKSISRPLLTAEGSSHGKTFVYTHRLDSSDRKSLAQVRQAPCQFQPLVVPSHELRVTTIGKRHFTVEIRTEDDEPGRFDWRATATNCEYKLGELDPQTGALLSRLLDKFGLQFAASDFIIDGNGDKYFLESNPHGAWMWLEAFVPDLDISGAIASWIMSRTC
ncbi:MvdC/MvdD family ATP grasp protein [Streptomyces microflavus]